MRILFLTLYPELAASPRYRVTQFLPNLRQHGVQCTVASALTPREHRMLTGPNRRGRALWYHLVETPRRIRQILSAGRYDIVFVQKALMTAYLRGMPGLLHRMARRVVYDLDDAVHLAPPHPLRAPWSVLEDRGQIYQLFEGADLVLAGNAWLAEEARATGARVELFPTVVDTDRFRPAATPPDRFRIGWIGNPSTMVCLDPASEALAGLPDGDLCLIGAEPAFSRWPKAEIRPWSLDSEVSELHRLTAGIMPMPEGPWMRGKCGLKALLYMACGLPCVATPYGAALEFIEDGVNGLLADSAEAWSEAFKRLQDPGLRTQLGAAGRATVEESYALNRAAPRLLELLESLC